MRILYLIPFTLLVFYWRGQTFDNGPSDVKKASNKSAVVTTPTQANTPLFMCDRMSDSLELVKFYNATGGTNWWKKWDLKKPMVTWFGVLYTVEGCVSSILLYDSSFVKICPDCGGQGNNLVGSLISLNLPNLQNLYLYNNQLTGTISNFDKLPNLQSLFLQNNPLTGTIPNFDKLPNLQSLSLGGNLTGTIPNFDKLPSLQSLLLQNNPLTGTIPNFDRLPNLQSLYLSNNPLTGTIPNFDKLPNLQSLTIRSNQLTGTIPNFDRLPNLLNLSLGGNLTGMIPNFDKLPNLQYLNLLNNKLTGTIPNFDKLANLLNLSLGSNKLTGTIPNFDKLSKINSLGFNDNQLTGTIPNFDKLPDLGFLNIRNNLLTGPIHDHSLSNPKLSFYILNNNRITFSGLIRNLKIVKNLTDKINKNQNDDTLRYAPQQKIYTNTTITIQPNTNYTLDLKIDDTVTTSTYTWYKNNVLYKTIKGSNKLLFAPFTTADAGTYTVKITNPHAPQLTLESWPIRLVVVPSLVCDRRSDSLELVKFYNATGGPNWWKKWDLRVSMNTWFGLTFSTEGCIEGININGLIDQTNTNLSGDLPNLNLPFLQYLSILNSSLSGNLPNFDKLPLLKVLSLYQNNINGPIPNFNKLVKLQYLSISKCNFNGDIPNFDNLPNLLFLGLSGNNFSGKVPNFEHLSNLEYLYLGADDFRSSSAYQGSTAIWAMQQLGSNNLSGPIPNFNSLSKLQYLYLDNNQLGGTIPNFDKLPNLYNLSLSSNQLTGTIPNFDKLPNLYNLFLYRNQLGGIIPNFDKLPNLQLLYLYDNQLTGTIHDHTLTNPKLTHYFLNYNRITFAGLIKNVKKVKTLTDDTNKLCPNCGDTLIYAPQQKIYDDTTITIQANTNYTLDLRIDDTVTTSTYTWYKNGVLDTIIKGKNKLSFTPFTTADAGTYTVKITNPHAPQLTLESLPIRLVVAPSLVCDRRSDSLELVKFYNATGGLFWTKKWDLSKPMSNWVGVSLTSLGCVKELTLVNNHLSGTISNFDNLPNIQYLALSDNQLSGPLPNFENMPNLQVLYLSGNQFVTSIPNFEKLPILQDLDLSRNHLSEPIPNFDKLHDLQVLYLSNNRLSGSIPNFDKLPNLQELDLSINQLSGPLPNFDKIPKMLHLYLWSNKLTGPIPNFNIPKLYHLHLNDNQLTGIIPNFNGLPLIKSLLLFGNQLTGPLLDHNFTNPKLDRFFIHDNKLTFSGLIKNIQNVKTLTDVSNKECPSCTYDTLIYAPQKKVYSDTTITVPVNTNYTIDLKIDDTVTTSTYTWYKNGVLDTIIKGKNKLPFAPFTSNDAGTYTVKITNPHVPQLTLESWPIRLDELTALCGSAPKVIRIQVDACGLSEQGNEFFQFITSAAFNLNNTPLAISTDAISRGSFQAVTQTFIDGLNAKTLPCPSALFVNPYAAPYNGIIPPGNVVLAFIDLNPVATDAFRVSLRSLCGKAPIFVIRGAGAANSSAMFLNKSGCAISCPRNINVTFGNCNRTYSFDANLLDGVTGAFLSVDDIGNVTYESSDGCTPVSLDCEKPAFITPNLSPLTCSVVGHELPEISDISTGNARYFTQPNRQGISYTVGTILYDSLLLYANDFNSCSPLTTQIEKTYLVRISPGPIFSPSMNRKEEACSFFILPVMEGSKLTGNQKYWTLPRGRGTGYKEGDTIRSTQTLFPYDIKFGCATEASITISVFPRLFIDNPKDTTVFCNINYRLPAITGSGFSGNAAYYTLPQKGSAPILPGAFISTPGRYYVFAQSNNCFDEDTFNINIRPKPIIPRDTFRNDTFCTSYNLPLYRFPLTYNTRLNGTGLPFSPGANIIADSKLYITVSFPGCTVQDSVVLTKRLLFINPTILPSICDPILDSLPRITGNFLTGFEAFYSERGGKGKKYLTGDSVHAFKRNYLYDSKLLYIYDSAQYRTGKCVHEIPFIIPFILIVESEPIPDTTIFCDQTFKVPVIEPNSLFNKAVYTLPNKKGTKFNAGAQINTAGTYYIFSEFAQCFDEDTFQVKFMPYSITLLRDQQKVKNKTPQLFDVLTNDNIPVGVVVNVTIDNPQNGTMIYSLTTGKGTYTPKTGFSGKEKLNYKVCPTACPTDCLSSTIEFEVEAPCADKTNLVLPNVIFPEGPTGANRYFFVEALEKCKEAFGPRPTKLSVYNRWGDLVFYSKDYLNNWEGTNNQGQPLPAGTYYYLLDLGSQAAPVKGYVVIMR